MKADDACDFPPISGLDAYILERRLSVGGTSEAFLALSKAHGERVVIKRLLPGPADDLEGRARLSHEASLLEALDHPCIPRLLGRGENHLVLSYLDGHDLRELLVQVTTSGEPAPPPLVASLGLLASLVLADLHEARDAKGHPLHAVHADVSPKNLRLRPDGRIGLIDFGSSRYALGGSPGDGVDGLIVGTHAYMSPEQVRGEPLDQGSDIFSLGVILWELAAGRRLFRRDSASATLGAVEMAKVPPLTEAAPACPETLARPIGACLSRERAYRPAPRELARALAVLVDPGTAKSRGDFDPAIAKSSAILVESVSRLGRKDDAPSLADYRASLDAMALGEDPQLTPERTDITRVSDASELAKLMSGLRPTAPRAIAGESPGTRAKEALPPSETQPPGDPRRVNETTPQNAGETAPATSPEATIAVLDHGLKVVTTVLPHLSLTSVALFVRVGSRFESPADSGLSHLLEHVLFRGSELYPDTYTLNTAIERVGTGLDAATSRDFTTFEATCLPERMPQMLKILGDMIARPRFVGVDIERRIITEELQDELDQKGRDVDPDNLSKMSLFSGSSMGQKVGGVLARVQRFDEADCRRWHARHYCARNMVLAITGPVDPETVRHAAAEAFATLSEGEIAVPGPARVRSDLPAFEFTRHTGSQADVLLSWVLPAEDHEDWAALSIAHRILDDGTCARLRHRIVDQLGLAYHASAELETYDGLSILTIATQTRHNQVIPVVDAMFAVVDELAKEPVPITELARMRTRLALELGAVRDSASATGYWNGLHQLYDAADGLASRWRRAIAVTADSLRDAVCKHLDLRLAQLVVVGDLGPVEKATLRRRMMARRGDRAVAT